MSKQTGFFNIPIESTCILCPQCIKEGKKSDVRLFHCFRHLSNCFWDQNGRYHKHFELPHRAIFKCSEWHRFEIFEQETCWCGYKGSDIQGALAFFNLVKLPSPEELIDLRAKKLIESTDFVLIDSNYSILMTEIQKRVIP